MDYFVYMREKKAREAGIRLKCGCIAGYCCHSAYVLSARTEEIVAAIVQIRIGLDQHKKMRSELGRG